ncbi:MAG: AAA family ATPase [Bacteroidales bacterium]|nr:AAA family ATPase [Bacteroidales bacterium]MBD5245622.1 AAA family ATPase [Barnesiella sp.]
MFNTLRIKYFRGVKSAEIEGFKRINLFFGKNNCGKSTVLEALFLVTGQSNPVLPLTVNSMRNYNKFSEDDLKIDFYNLNPENKICISALGDVSRWLEISIVKSDSKTINLDSIAVGTTDNAAKAYGYKLVYSIGDNENRYTSELILKEGDQGKGKISRDKRYKEEMFSQYIPSSSQPSSLEEEFGKIVANKEEKFILSALREVEPAIKDIQLVGDEILVDIGASQRLPINMMGDGLRKLLMLILAVYRCSNGVLLVDEIDNGFHFSTMKVLWKVILKVAENNNVQLFATTHNIDSLKGLSAVLSESAYESYADSVSAFKLIKDNEGIVTSLSYDYQSFRYSINQELEMR